MAAIGAIRAGADDVVLTPINRNDLVEVLDPRVASAAASDSANLGQLVSFVHVSGGVGATTLAVNCAAVIAKSEQAGRVCLLDMDVQYGNIASLLDIARTSPVDGLIDDPASLDRGMFENMLVKSWQRRRSVDGAASALRAGLLSFGHGREPESALPGIIPGVVVADLPVALAPWTDIVLRESSVVVLSYAHQRSRPCTG